MDPAMMMLMSFAAQMSKFAGAHKALDAVCTDMESKRETWNPGDESFYGLVSTLRDFAADAQRGCDRLDEEARKAEAAMGDNVIRGDFGGKVGKHGPGCLC